MVYIMEVRIKLDGYIMVYIILYNGIYRYRMAYIDIICIDRVSVGLAPR
jgi:hypothetical protein